MHSSIHLQFLTHGLLAVATICSVSAVPTLEGNRGGTSVQPRDATSTPNPLDYAPDTSKDPFPPYPPMTNTDGSNVTVENLRGVRFFGWKGCSSPDVKTISDSFDDFALLAKQEALWKNIDWNDPAAKEIWGHGTGNKALTDDRKAQIQQIFAAAEQVRDKAWWQPPYDDFVPPWLAWRYLWIEIACSSVDGDPDNSCGDRPKKDPSCPGGRDPPAGGMDSDMEAFSNPLGRYSKITFCERFLSKMDSLGTVIDDAKNTLTPPEKNDLWNYQNRARTVFHEVTHLNYFMNAPDKSPYVDDLELPFGPSTRRTYLPGYGPERIKILANYEAANKGGFFTQRNADSYAWFAVSKYIEQEVGLYPSDPVISQKPAAAPRDGNKKLFATSSDTEDGNNADVNSIAPPVNSTDPNITSDKGWVPACPDHPQILSDTFGVDSVNISKLSITCDQSQLSGLPYNVFHGEAGNVYDKFCFNLDSTIGQEWTVNINGDQNPKKLKRESGSDTFGLRLTDSQPHTKRTPPPNPASYDKYSFDLTWETNNQTLGCGQNVDSCRDVFAAIANSPCGHQASEQNIMAAAGKADVQGCGTYSYKITSPTSIPPVPTPQTTSAPAPTGPVDCTCANEDGCPNQPGCCGNGTCPPGSHY